MEGADVVRVSEQREIGLSLSGWQREDIDNRVLTSRDRVTCASPLNTETGDPACYC